MDDGSPPVAGPAGPASSDRPLAELLSALAERSPAPGGGCAAAWTAALAAALVEMAARYAGDDAEGPPGAPAVRAAVLRAELLAEGERELQSYAPVLAAMRLPRSDPERPARLDAALEHACAAPLAIARAAAELAELAAALAAAVAETTPAVRGDAVTAVLLAEAATRSAVALVESNLAERGADPRRVEAERLSGRALHARRSALAEPLTGLTCI